MTRWALEPDEYEVKLFRTNKYYDWIQFSRFQHKPNWVLKFVGKVLPKILKVASGERLVTAELFGAYPLNLLHIQVSKSRKQWNNSTEQTLQSRESNSLLIHGSDDPFFFPPSPLIWREVSYLMSGQTLLNASFACWTRIMRRGLWGKLDTSLVCTQI